MPIYLQYPSTSGGSNIAGDVTVQAYQGWIALTGVQWGAGLPITVAEVGQGAQRTLGPFVSWSDIALTKNADSASWALQQEMFTGTGQNIEIDYVGTAGDYLKLTLTNCVISGYASSGGDSPAETLTVNFLAYQYQWTGNNPDGTQGNQGVASYDRTNPPTRGGGGGSS